MGCNVISRFDEQMKTLQNLFISVFFFSWISCAPMTIICVNVAVVTGKGPDLDGRYILKKRSDEKPADACVNGCIYYKDDRLDEEYCFSSDESNYSDDFSEDYPKFS